jgi:hypothetical protein
LASDLAIEGILSAPKIRSTIKKIKTISAPLMKRLIKTNLYKDKNPNI